MPARASVDGAPWAASPLNHARNRSISRSTTPEGGASKCTLGACVRPDTICIGASSVR